MLKVKIFTSWSSFISGSDHSITKDGKANVSDVLRAQSPEDCWKM